MLLELFLSEQVSGDLILLQTLQGLRRKYAANVL